MIELQFTWEAKLMVRLQTNISRRSLLLGGAVAAASAGLGLPGCAASSGPSSPASSGDAEPSPTSDEASLASSASAPEVAVLSGASAYASANYDPIGLNGGASFTMSATRHVFEGLYDLDLHTFEPYPALAEGDPQKVSDLEYAIALREGACFSDGTAVTSNDVVNALQKNMADGTLGPLLGFIASASAQDERTVLLSLKHPFETLLKARLSLVKVFPASREATLATRPIGSGPWVYVPGGLNGGNRITFTPNAHYNGPFPAEAESMAWTAIEDDGMRATALRDHAVHVAEGITSESAIGLEQAGARVRYVQGFNQPFLMFNTLKRPFSDKRIRQALLYAIDAQRIVEELFDGRAELLTGFLPKSHPCYHRASTVYAHDPEKARALIAETGVDQLAFTLTVNNNWVAALAPMIVEDLAACGIACEAKEGAIRWNEFAETDDVLPYDVVLAAGDPSCFGNDVDLLLSWWYGDNVWTRGRTCWARDERGSFAAMQELLQAARVASGETQQELWNRCFDIVADEVPLYGLFHRQQATAWLPGRIGGFTPIGTSGLDFLGCTVA